MVKCNFIVVAYLRLSSDFFKKTDFSFMSTTKLRWKFHELLENPHVKIYYEHYEEIDWYLGDATEAGKRRS